MKDPIRRRIYHTRNKREIKTPNKEGILSRLFIRETVKKNPPEQSRILTHEEICAEQCDDGSWISCKEKDETIWNGSYKDLGICESYDFGKKIAIKQDKKTTEYFNVKIKEIDDRWEKLLQEQDVITNMVVKSSIKELFNKIEKEYAQTSWEDDGRIQGRWIPEVKWQQLQQELINDENTTEQTS